MYHDLDCGEWNVCNRVLSSRHWNWLILYFLAYIPLSAVNVEIRLAQSMLKKEWHFFSPKSVSVGSLHYYLLVSKQGTHVIHIEYSLREFIQRRVYMYVSKRSLMTFSVAACDTRTSKDFVRKWVNRYIRSKNVNKLPNKSKIWRTWILKRRIKWSSKFLRSTLLILRIKPKKYATTLLSYNWHW